MPDYSDEEIDKASDDASESDEVMINGKPVNEIDNVKFNHKFDIIKAIIFINSRIMIQIF